MKTSDLVFVGIKGSVVALNRATGEQVWATHLKGWGFVTVVLEHDMILASCDGEIFSLDPLTGSGGWHNPLKGYGTGLVTIVTEQNPRDGNLPAKTEQQRQDEQQAAHVSASPTVR